jgi:hypothetical protein
VTEVERTSRFTSFVNGGFMMKTNKRNAFLFLLAAVCFLFVGIVNYEGRPLTFYGSIVAGILFIIVAINNYKRKDG